SRIAFLVVCRSVATTRHLLAESDAHSPVRAGNSTGAVGLRFPGRTRGQRLNGGFALGLCFAAPVAEPDPRLPGGRNMSLLFNVEDHIATLTFNRPEVMNAMDPDTYAELSRAWIEVRD